MRVRFSSLCDFPSCGARSEEYATWPDCRDCGEQFCGKHQEPGSYREPDESSGHDCLCRECATEERRVVSVRGED